MAELTDHELLVEFARTESERAFGMLVTRYVNLVYSAALRFTGNSHHAEEITQAVFIILARKAGKLSPRVVLSGWLYQAARLTAANLVKGESRRHHREQEAYMQSTLNESDAAWQQIAPLLDEAMGGLGENDRNAVVLRFFENKTAAEVAGALKLTEAAAHKRVNRALEKLRKFFTRRGVSSTAAIFAGAISANSVQAAPAALAKAVTAVAVVKGATASISTLTLIKGALKIMAWTKMKTVAVVGVAVILAAGMTDLAVKHHRQPHKPMPAAAGSSQPSKQTFQGHWTGSNTAHPGQTCTLNISGTQIEYRGTDQNDWLRGTFVLNENTEPQQLNVTMLEPAQSFIVGIYEVKGDKVTIAVAPHGSSQRPVDYTPGPQVDVLELQHD
jgi:RNA polymerase sigma factor (sigma-70 family)